MADDELSLFMWGYWGWGGVAGQFVRAADAVEESRGFAPPLFADVRIRRNVRAVGFRDAAFEGIAGPARYRWLPSLGNRSVVEGRPDIRIADPAAVEDLLDLALERARDRHRVIFFCACEIPGHEDRNGCHRTAVARLAIEAVSRRRLGIRVQEWPGGEPSHDAALVVGPGVVRKLDRGAKSVPLGEPESLAAVAGLPWYSVVQCRTPDRSSSCNVLVGPARYSTGTGWWLPRLGGAPVSAPHADLIRLAGELRALDGYNAASGRPIGLSG